MKSIFDAIILSVILLIAYESNGQRRVITEDLFTNQIFELLSKKEIRNSSVSHFLLKIGDHRNALRFSDAERMLGFDTITQVDVEYFRKFKPYDANQKIPEIADEYQVVMINEAHGNPQHRVFTKSLLAKLYEKGYRYLFLEGLSTQEGIPREFQDTILHERKYLLDSPVSGFYVTEPQFSNMVRHALNLGYAVLPYDGRGKNRENESVNNIGKTLDKNPFAKLVIHCGFGHIYEEEFMNSSWLGKKMKDSLGIDPLTIDQVNLTENPGGIESPFYSMMSFDEPTIFMNPENRFYNGFTNMKHIDLLVYQPRTIYTFNRPHWLIQQEGYKLIEVKEIKEFPLLIKAFKSSDDSKAVPIDTIEKRSQNDPSYLVLPTGEYRVQIIGKKGVLETRNIVVN